MGLPVALSLTMPLGSIKTISTYGHSMITSSESPQVVPHTMTTMMIGPFTMLGPGMVTCQLLLVVLITVSPGVNVPGPCFTFTCILLSPEVGALMSGRLYGLIQQQVWERDEQTKGKAKDRRKLSVEEPARSQRCGRFGLRLMQIRPQGVAGDEKAALHQFFGLLEGAVFVLDAEHVVVTNGIQRGDKARPIHLA